MEGIGMPGAEREDSQKMLARRRNVSGSDAICGQLE
jgi:hypothetical protein